MLLLISKSPILVQSFLVILNCNFFFFSFLPCFAFKCASLHLPFLQAKAALEKTKATLEAENQEMASDLKSVQMAKTESERKRKQAEQQLAEMSIRVQEVEQGRGESLDKAAKLHQELEQVSTVVWMCNVTLSCLLF